MTATLDKLKIKLFTDGADKAQIAEMAKLNYVAGFTTNQSLLKKAGVKDYESYARELVGVVPDRHISFEVISDDIEEMVAQARLITTWGKNVHVKLPVINTKGESLIEAIRLLSNEGVKINVTVVTTVDQAKRATSALAGGPGGCVSVFAGRLADLGIDPTRHAYGAAVWTLLGYVGLHVAAGAFMALWCCVRIALGMIDAWRCLTLRICLLWWRFTLPVAALMLFVVAGFPHVVS